MDETQWHTPALRGLDVQGLIGHLIGVENDVERALRGDSGAASADHVASTQATAEAQHGRSGVTTLQEWAAATGRTHDLLADGDPDRAIAVHGLRLTAGSLCVVRTFELWTHENDIRRALGMPPTDPDASTLTLMTDFATAILPRAAAMKQLANPAALRLVLTGPGGGTWQLRLGDGESPATEVGVITGAAAFCRLVANRESPAGLDAYITGDPVAVRTLLQAATTLALD